MVRKSPWGHLAKMNLTIIAAISENNVIGDKDSIPWNHPEDLARFRQMTLNHTVIMGHKTHRSLSRRLGGPLTDRRNIVLSKQEGLKLDGVIVCSSFEDALDACQNEEEVYVIGGSQIYAEALPHANQMEITRIHYEVAGDAFFPEVEWHEWLKKGEIKSAEYSFITYKRKTRV